MTISRAIAADAVCKPNISPAGRRLRQRSGFIFLAISVAGAAALVAAGASWYWRALVTVPAALSAICFLQAARNTCVARAAEGTFEHDDLSKTKAPDDEVAASRVVAAQIRRDTILIGLACGALAVASAFILR
jgi:hypothetical protein